MTKSHIFTLNIKGKIITLREEDEIVAKKYRSEQIFKGKISGFSICDHVCEASDSCLKFTANFYGGGFMCLRPSDINEILVNYREYQINKIGEV